MQTIKQIRTIQLTCQIGLSIIVIVALIFTGAILGFYHLSTDKGHLLGDVFIGVALVTGILLLVLRRARCPVCKNIFIGKTEPRWFSVTCKNCGRRSGDTH